MLIYVLREVDEIGMYDYFIIYEVNVIIKIRRGVVIFEI